MTTEPQVPQSQGNAVPAVPATPGGPAQQHIQPPRPPGGPAGGAEERSRWRYGVIVVCAGFATIVACFIAAIEVFGNAESAVSVLAPC